MHILHRKRETFQVTDVLRPGNTSKMGKNPAPQNAKCGPFSRSPHFIAIALYFIDTDLPEKLRAYLPVCPYLAAHYSVAHW
jgi:hypothetical protein